MWVIFLIIGIILLGIILFFVIKHLLFEQFILRNFRRSNVIVFGKKGSGKDLLFQWVIHKRKKEEYYSNISYGYKFNYCSLLDVSVFPNTYETIVNDEIYKYHYHL